MLPIRSKGCESFFMHTCAYSKLPSNFRLSKLLMPNVKMNKILVIAIGGAILDLFYILTQKDPELSDQVFTG